MKLKLLVFLQNAWRHNAKPGDIVWLPAVPERSKALWEKALWACVTGRKLGSMLPDGLETTVTNASPRIGSTAASKFPMDPAYVRAELETNRPAVVLLCGAEAQKAKDYVDLWAIAQDLDDFPVIACPHPAWRMLSRQDSARVKSALSELVLAEATNILRG